MGLRGGRSLEDEQMIQCIVDANPNADIMYMIDTRPKVWGVAPVRGVCHDTLYYGQ